MDKEQLCKIIKEMDECEWVKFKTNYPAEKFAKEIGEYISALSNAAAYHKIDEAYMIWGVEIPIDKSGFSGATTQEIENTTQKTTQKKIIELLKGNQFLSRSDLAIVLNMSNDGIKYHLNQLKKKGLITIWVQIKVVIG